MENLKVLLEEKKYDDVISACVDETSAEQLLFKAMAMAHKRDYPMFAELFSKALHIAKDIEVIYEVLGIRLFDVVSEVSSVLREEINDMLREFEVTDDGNILLDMTNASIRNVDSLEKIIEAYNAYISLPIAREALGRWYATCVGISSDVTGFFEKYFDKVFDEYRNGFNGTDKADTLEKALDKMAKLKKIQDRGRYTLLGAVYAEGLLKETLKWPKKFEDDVIEQRKEEYLRVIGLMYEFLEAHLVGVSGDPVYLCSDDVRKTGVQTLSTAILSYKTIDPEFQAPPLPKINSTSSNTNKSGNTNQSSGGCYVATAVYGSYDCPQVWTLRRYRDDTLANNVFGRAFVKLYYAVSPTIVKWFGNTNWFSKLWRKPLDKMVKKLNDNGVENTPYDDVEW